MDSLQDRNNQNKSFKPFIPADKRVSEFTATSVILGVILAALFGGANAYLGLRVGMTVSASIPAAVISMGVIRILLRKDSILENNMVQTIGSAGESLAAGAIFTMPVLFMWAEEGKTDLPGLAEIALISICGGVLGVLFMIPLRSALIVQEHGILPYPEGTACARVLLAGEKGGARAGTVFAGLGISALYKFVADGLCLFPSEVDFSIKKYKGAGVGIDVLPALLGVGYICGLRVSSYLLAGGVLAWLVLMPLIVLLGGDAILYPADLPISQLDTWGIWSNYIRYIGAGAVAAGGIISLLKALPLIFRTFAGAVRGYGKGMEEEERTARDIPMSIVLCGILLTAVAMWLIPVIPVNLFGAIVIILLGFFFATVSSRMVGLVGSSNNPVSGMAIATLIVTASVFKATNEEKGGGMVSAIVIGTIICIIAAMAGDTSQDLKTGYLVGATPKKQQYGELISVVVSALTIGGVLYLLNEAWGYGSSQLPAPQAMLMKMVVEGVMGGNLPWNLVFAGVAIAVMVEILSIPVLPFAVGLYLPIHLSTPMVVGGLIRLWFEKQRDEDEDLQEEMVESGILYSSGLIAGEGLVGILLAVLAILPADGGTIGGRLAKMGEQVNFGSGGSLILFALLSYSLIFAIRRTGRRKGQRR